jgi:hypothetical protein
MVNKAAATKIPMYFPKVREISNLCLYYIKTTALRTTNKKEGEKKKIKRKGKEEKKINGKHSCGY